MPKKYGWILVGFAVVTITFLFVEEVRRKMKRRNTDSIDLCNISANSYKVIEAPECEVGYKPKRTICYLKCNEIDLK